MTKDVPASHIMSQNQPPVFAAIAAESVDKKLGKEKCSKVAEYWACGSAGADLRPEGALRLNFVSQCREQAGWVYDRPRFKAKKEIPVDFASAHSEVVSLAASQEDSCKERKSRRLARSSSFVSR
jgi:hypothetical protein